MSKLEIVFGSPINLYGEQSMYIYADYWDSQSTALMYELTPMSYHSAYSCYEASIIDLEYLERRCKEMNLEYHITKLNEPEANPEDSTADLDITDSKYKYKTEPLSHQLVGIEFGMNRPRYLLGDDMGLGKTKQVIDIACRKKYELYPNKAGVNDNELEVRKILEEKFATIGRTISKEKGFRKK